MGRLVGLPICRAGLARIPRLAALSGLLPWVLSFFGTVDFALFGIAFPPFGMLNLSLSITAGRSPRRRGRLLAFDGLQCPADVAARPGALIGDRLATWLDFMRSTKWAYGVRLWQPLLPLLPGGLAATRLPVDVHRVPCL